MKRLLSVAVAAALSVTAAMSARDFVYHDLSVFPVIGTAAPDASKAYSRLPDSLKSQIRPELWNLGLNSAGLAIRFASDASDISARWKALNKFNMNHMTATGIRGLDLYVMLPDSSWTTLGAARPAFNSHNSTSTIVTDMKPAMREYMLYLPLYDGVDSVMIGTDSAAVVIAPRVDLPSRQKPLVMYGSSILQGGCATRPGMVHTSIIERELNREVYNFGFSGNARLDPEIARVMASVDAGAYVIDALPNCKREQVLELTEPFYRIIREARPGVPVVFVESEPFPVMRFSEEVRQTVTEKNEALRQVYDSLVARGETDIYYMPASDILGDCVEGTVDNYHMTDLGFEHFARGMMPLLRKVLGLDSPTE